MIEVTTPTVAQSSLGLSVNEALQKYSKKARKQFDCSSVKTLDVLRMINSVNELKDKNEIL